MILILTKLLILRYILLVLFFFEVVFQIGKLVTLAYVVGKVMEIMWAIGNV